MPPKFQAGQTEAKVQVTEIAANSKVGFREIMASVNEGNYCRGCFKMFCA